MAKKISRMLGFLKPGEADTSGNAHSENSASAKNLTGAVDEAQRQRQQQAQWDTLKRLYQTVPSHPAFEKVETKLRKVLESLQRDTLNNPLVQSYPAATLNDAQAHTQQVFKNIHSINRKRVNSWFQMATEDMQKVMAECLMLFEINPTKVSSLELPVTEGYDYAGNPIWGVRQFPAFQENALFGIAGVERFLPPTPSKPQEGRLNVKDFLNTEYPDLMREWGRDREDPSIAAVTTIGSLGGIGHKPDSNMDVQLIFNTGPSFGYRWNDADFLLAAMLQILEAVQEGFLEKSLPYKTRESLKGACIRHLQKKYQDRLQDEELKIIQYVLPSTYQQYLIDQTWLLFNRQPPASQRNLFRKYAIPVLKQLPDLAPYLKALVQFLPLLQDIPLDKLHQSCFPYILKSPTPEQMHRWLRQFYEHHYLGRQGTEHMVEAHAEKNQLDPKQIQPKQARELILKHLRENRQRVPIFKGFLQHIAENTAYGYRKQLHQLAEMVQQAFKKEGNFFPMSLIARLEDVATQAYRRRLQELIISYSNWDALYRESQTEYAIHQKVKVVEEYLRCKYPKAEVGIFPRVLRKQRVGEHTPFIVSPKSGTAYSLMLNDVLLNPGVMIAGMPPMPFNLSEDLKVFSQTEILKRQSWLFESEQGDLREQLSLQQLPDWGGFNITRERFWTRAVPIFLQESEKVSHGRLPLALLNCWWIEMLCCLEKDRDPLTSLTQLLLYPERRTFVRNKVEHKMVEAVQSLETDFPMLLQDPNWLKFTEMLFRFDPWMRQQIVFCFALSVRISDIINYTDNGNPIWLPPDAPWRLKVLVKFYEKFFGDSEERTKLAWFSQGRDDVGRTVSIELKQAFMDSMRRVERKLLKIINQRSLDSLNGYLVKWGNISKDVLQVRKSTLKHLEDLHTELILVSEQLLRKAESGQELTKVEKRQLPLIQKDQEQLLSTARSLANYYRSRGLTAYDEGVLQCIRESRIDMAGDPLENWTFQYHFNRSFKKRPHQLPLPVSRRQSVPRKLIMTSYQARKDRWKFQSVLSKSETGAGRSTHKSENEVTMFEAPLAYGLAQCVVSGYVGVQSWNLTSFRKPPVSDPKTDTASNTMTQQDLQDLAFAMHRFFPRESIIPRELLEDVQYITKVFVVGNANFFGCVSIVVKDNFADFFVLDYDLRSIKVQLPEGIKGDENFYRFFYQLNSKESRARFVNTIKTLQIPFSVRHPADLTLWIHHADFAVPTTPTFYRTYVNGIANSLWHPNTLGSSAFLMPTKIKQTLEKIGQESINEAKRQEAKAKASRDRYLQRVARQSREHMKKKQG